MNLRAKCVNTNCDAYDKVKSVAIGTLTGYGVNNERVRCPLCSELMQTTKSVAVKPRGGGRTTAHRKQPVRNSGRER